MPADVIEMRPLISVFRQMDALTLLLEQHSQFDGNPVVGHKQTVVVRQRNQMPIKQPVSRRRQRTTVLHNVWSTFGNWPDMSRLSLGLPAAVEHSQAADGTCVPISLADVAPEVCIAHFPIHENLNGTPLLLFRRSIHESQGLGRSMREVELEPQGIGRVQSLLEAGSNDVANSMLWIVRTDFPCNVRPRLRFSTSSNWRS